VKGCVKDVELKSGMSCYKQAHPGSELFAKGQTVSGLINFDDIARYEITGQNLICQWIFQLTLDGAF
jgi:hypothetical protein